MHNVYSIIFWMVFIFTPSDVAIAQADVERVLISGNPGAYRFAVTVKSPDTGCVQYADWWEVVSEEGELLYRRILSHSHIDEQPFTRSGGPVKITSEQTVWVRAHMNNTGYGGVAMKGSPADGFEVAAMPDDFALDLEKIPPQPVGCRF
ncbi:MAG: hypothetical protein R3345_01405 [Fulvivirga sp.]|nr:hypothetical protein [Fulvivirga sp.]